jgi:hypothetical protein
VPAAAADHAPLHGRDVLRLVDDDVRVLRALLGQPLGALALRLLAYGHELLQARELVERVEVALPAGTGRGAEDRLEFVEHGHVVHGEPVPLEGARHAPDLAGVEDPPRPAPEPLLVGHRLQDGARGQLGPPGVQERDEAVLGADVLVERRAQFRRQLGVGVPGPGAGLRPEAVEQQLAGARAQQVHGRGPGERVVPDALQLGCLQLQPASEGDDAKAGGRSCRGLRIAFVTEVVAGFAERELPGPLGRTRLSTGPARRLQRSPSRLPQHLQHPVRTLGPGHGRRVVQRGLGAVDQGADRADGDLALLAEGRQDALGVRHQQRRGRDDQDAARVPATVLVEQVRGPVQGDRRLAGAGPALHVRHRRGGCPDDEVLLGLDGGDDVPHGVAAGLAQRGHQRTVADHRQFTPGKGGFQLRAHQVVLDPEDLAALGADDPTAYDPAGIDRRGAVERRGRRGPPVDHQRRVVRVQDADTADVECLRDLGGVVGPYGALGGFDRRVRAVRALLAVLAEEQVDPSEEEVLELVVQAVEVDPRPEHLRVTLRECSRRTDLAALGGVVHEELRLVDLLLEAPVHPVQVFLFDADLAVAHGVAHRIERRFLLNLSGHRAPF